jgi:hypothetical protein
MVNRVKTVTLWKALATLVVALFMVEAGEMMRMTQREWCCLSLVKNAIIGVETRLWVKNAIIGVETRLWA